MIIYIDKSTLKHEPQYVTKGGKIEFIKRINELIELNVKFKIYGVWNGNCNTDLFDMNIPVLLKRLSK